MLSWKKASVKLNEEALINAIALITKDFYIYIICILRLIFKLLRGLSNITNVKSSNCKNTKQSQKLHSKRVFCSIWRIPFSVFDVSYKGFVLVSWSAPPPLVCSIKLIVFCTAEAGFHVLSVVWMKLLIHPKEQVPLFLGSITLKKNVRKKKKSHLSRHRNCSIEVWFT